MSLSGPAVATMTSWRSTCWRVTQGRTRPYSKRTTHSWRTRTEPSLQRRVRTRSARPSPVGITSRSTSTPVGVVNVVSSIALLPT